MTIISHSKAKLMTKKSKQLIYTAKYLQLLKNITNLTIRSVLTILRVNNDKQLSKPKQRYQ